MITVWENEAGPGSASTLTRSLNHLLDSDERGLAVKATRTVWAARSCDVCAATFAPHSYQQLRCSSECSDVATRAYQAARIRTDRQAAGYTRFAQVRKYGLTLARYDEILESQGGGCAVCGGLNRGRRLEVDHDHRCCPGLRACGKCVRGLLCGPCNKALGQLRDDPELLRRAAEYLEVHRVGS